MVWALHRTEKEKPAAGKTGYWRDFWRRRWDSNPRTLADQLISSQSRYDHFDTSPYLSQHQHLRKRGELMGRTSKNIKLRIPEKSRKIKGFRTGSYRVATTISSADPSTTWVHLRMKKIQFQCMDNMISSADPSTTLVHLPMEPLSFRPMGPTLAGPGRDAPRTRSVEPYCTILFRRTQEEKRGRAAFPA